MYKTRCIKHALVYGEFCSKSLLIPKTMNAEESYKNSTLYLWFLQFCECVLLRCLVKLKNRKVAQMLQKGN